MNAKKRALPPPAPPLLALFLLALPLLSGCGTTVQKLRNLNLPGWLEPYRFTLQEGNIYDEDLVAQLREGMSRDDVIFILGTPRLKDPFHKNRWDYFYITSRGNKILSRHHLILLFADDELYSITEVTPSPRSFDDPAPSSPEEPLQPRPGGENGEEKDE